VRQPAVADQRVQLAELLGSGVSVVRPDPAVSSAGELAVAAALGPPPGRSQRELDAGRRLEQELAGALPRSGYPLGDVAAVLRAYRDRSCTEPQQVAFLLPQQFVDRPESAGASLDGDCQQEGRRLTLIRSDQSLALEHPVVVLDWKDTAQDAAPAMARRFRDWLLSGAGQQAVTAAGLQVPPPGTQPAAGETPWPAAMNRGLLDRVDAALEFQSRVRRHARIVFALDSSLSMGTSMPAARAAVEELVGRLGEQDEIGLATFGREPVRPVPPGPAGRESDRSALRDRVRAAALAAEPAGETPLWPGIGQALALMRPVPRGEDAPTAAVVVVTDGRIALGEAARRRVVAQARREGVRGFVVAVGVGGCDARLTGVAEQLGGRCAEPGDRTPGGGLDGMAAAIWGAASGG
jgi:Mg-chelatase subunit ChlD